MNNCSIIKEIKKAEEAIQSCYDRVSSLEKKLETEDLPAEQARTIQSELSEVRKLLTTNEEHLTQLQGHNRQSFAVAAALIFIIFLIYGLYVLITGGDF